MTTSAPQVRIVDALTGSRAPTKFFQALSEADEHVALAAECERLREENAELQKQLGLRHETIGFLSSSRENAMTEGDGLALAVYRLRRDNAKLQEVADGLACAVDRLSDERDEALVRAQELWAQVCDQAAELNQLRAQLDRARAERDTYRLAVSK